MDRKAVGIDLGGTNIKGALVNPKGEILAWEKICTEAEKGLDHVLQRVEDLVSKLTRENEGSFVVGMGVPGMLDVSRERVIYAPNLKWENVELKVLLERRLGLPVFLDNDGNAAALGEAWIGAGQKSNYFMLVTIGTGIGSGLILDGKVYRGASGLAPELGHMTILPDGPGCGCGKKGCLEALTCAPAIFCKAEEKGLKLKVPEAGEVFDRARKGDALALRVVEEIMEYLSVGVANVLVLLDLELILMGGGVAEASDVFLELLRRKVIQKLPVLRDVRIAKAILGNKAGALGAARLAFLEWGG